MMIIKRRNHEWFKKTITIDEGKERLRIQNKYGWNFLNYLYTPRRNPNFDKWGTFVKKFKTLFENVQEWIIKKPHGGMEMLTHSRLLKGLKNESKYKTSERGGVGAHSLAHNTLRGRGVCWSFGMGLKRVDKLHSLTRACTQPTQGG